MQGRLTTRSNIFCTNLVPRAIVEWLNDGSGYEIDFALAKTNNTQIKLKEEQKEAVRQIVNGRDVKSLIYQLLPSMFDYINSRKRNIFAV